MGRAFRGRTYYTAKDLASIIETFQDPEELIQFVAQLNGFFAIIAQLPGAVVACVDKIRSIPIFYASREARFYASDDAEWVRQQVGARDVDALARLEFLLTGYVTGEDTLFPDVKQLQAGECIVASYHSDGLKVEARRYYRFNHNEPNASVSEKQLQEQLTAIMTGAIRRLVEVADGRQLVIPLSGGYDSRLIVLLLRELGYENLVTFTYGVPENHEARISREVANALGYRWEFVPYSRRAWREWDASPEREAFRIYGSGWASLPHVQDWPAVWALQKQGLVSSDAMFVPGHTGDFICGGHIPPALRTARTIQARDVVDSIFFRHYNLLQPNRRRIREWHELFRNRILERTEAVSIGNAVEAANAYEKWEWQERQGKYIVNSVRVYEFWGYEWWCPFWDFQVMHFWENVALRYRTPEIYQTVIKNIWSHVADGRPWPQTTAFRQRLVPLPRSAKSVLRKSLLAARLVGLLSALRHPLAGFGGHSPLHLASRIVRGYSLLGLETELFLAKVQSLSLA